MAGFRLDCSELIDQCKCYRRRLKASWEVWHVYVVGGVDGNEHDDDDEVVGVAVFVVQRKKPDAFPSSNPSGKPHEVPKWPSPQG